jgi:hypothetical protein
VQHDALVALELLLVVREARIGVELEHPAGDVDRAGDRAVGLALPGLPEVDDDVAPFGSAAT